MHKKNVVESSCLASTAPGSLCMREITSIRLLASISENIGWTAISTCLDNVDDES